ncbi:hypothetical protein VCRA2126O85_410044 [Vibrio crassostreae]|nr:hypothetical protein VCRA2128O106_400001 [Vibrio crassostreae]CAK2946047.1 hypothetical protein VCRA2128O100_420001 [Vibrio crassostreae]CAK2949322.1 hypothetical protein VCRA2126O84_400001 [Vibrio crassostreae]CAK2950084.1 hypothetical protein VCRA2125O83_400044 [Vibrio crassostreae]CAK2951655.1 hypothetical protein VCRA2126O86_410044 [Vibrio crassostreae]
MSFAPSTTEKAEQPPQTPLGGSTRILPLALTLKGESSSLLW